MLRLGHRQVVGVDDRAREQGRAREGQQRAGQDQHVGGPGRGRADQRGAAARPAEARTGDWSTQVVARRWRIGASRRIRWTHTAFQAVVMTLARTAIIVPVGPAKAAAAGTTQKPAVGAHGPRLQRRSARRCASPRVTRAAARRSHSPADEGDGPEQLAGRGQPPGGDQRERGRRDEDLDPEDDGPDPLHAGSRPRRAPPEQPTHDEADQAEHALIVAAGRTLPAQLTPAGSRIRCADAHSTDPRGAGGGDCRASLAHAPLLPSLGSRDPLRG